ncbi:MAG: hypothetical protein J5367_00610 [Lachnospiraceae bacterium]|nr:hypothetical protein [Lachnospiraceae bacterium]
MKKRIFAEFAAMLIAILMCQTVFAETDTTVDSAGNVFSSGDEVKFSDKSIFGAFTVGKEVEIEDSEAKGAVYAAGQTVSIDDCKVRESVFAAGNDVSVTGCDIDGNVFAAGNNVSVSSGTEANGVYLAGTNVEFVGVAKGLYIGGTNVSVDGVIDGDVTIDGTNVEIKDGTVIMGKLTVKSANEPVIADDAEIVDYDYEEVTDDDDKSSAFGAAGLAAALFKKLTSGIYWIVAMAAFGMLLCWLFGEHLDTAATFMKTRPGAMVGSGIIGWICVPVVSIMLCCTYILAPVGGLLFLFYVLLLCAGLAFAGASLVRLFLPNMNVFLSALIGIAALEIVRLIPFIGALVGIVADMYLIGYVIQRLWIRRLRKSPKPEVIEAE